MQLCCCLISKLINFNIKVIPIERVYESFQPAEQRWKAKRATITQCMRAGLDNDTVDLQVDTSSGVIARRKDPLGSDPSVC